MDNNKGFAIGFSHRLIGIDLISLSLSRRERNCVLSRNVDLSSMIVKLSGFSTCRFHKKNLLRLRNVVKFNLRFISHPVEMYVCNEVDLRGIAHCYGRSNWA